MKVLIIEDEPLAARDLTKNLLEVEPSAEVLAVLSSVKEANAWFDHHSMPDLILSDIQLSDGISFEIFESRHIRCPLIFTTAYDEYAIRAFKLNSIDYLLKPIDSTELAPALEKFRSLDPTQHLPDQLRGLLQTWGQDRRKYKERFLCVQRNSMVPVLESEIAFFHKEELIYVHTVTGEKLIGEHATLDEVEDLVDPARFFRVNRQYLVHVQSVLRVKTTHKGLSVQLKPPFNVELDVSREKANAFRGLTQIITDFCEVLRNFTMTSLVFAVFGCVRHDLASFEVRSAWLSILDSGSCDNYACIVSYTTTLSQSAECSSMNFWWMG
jgi:two-component system LytT family response regulator